MADPIVTANAGSGGASFAVDLDSSSYVHPLAKIEWGVQGTQIQTADVTGARLPTKPIGPSGAFQDASGTAGGSYADFTALASNSNRQHLLVWNDIRSPGPIAIQWGSAAGSGGEPTSGAYLLAPGASYEMKNPGFVSTDAIHLAAETSGTIYGVKWA